ncbi:flagellar export chaperone FliS [Nocardioides sp. YIM 152588]|uniref:flagellar export chaperone FliS n=1 Tax=Nocardioides sp. YIM 152588 TaxID=3158259 RepID=UPI0032E3BD5C
MTSSALAGSARAAYTSNALTTASPARLLVMLWDRLVLDITRGAAAIDTAEWDEARTNLLHAQDIVVELEVSLDVEAMPAGRQLASLYEYLRGRLVHANIHRDPAAAREALKLASELAETWRQAAMTAAVQ